RNSKEPRAGPLDRLHQPVCLDELEEDVLQHVLRIDVGHALPNEPSQPALFALDRLGDLPVLIGHDLFEDQDLLSSERKTDGTDGYFGFPKLLTGLNKISGGDGSSRKPIEKVKPGGQGPVDSSRKPI